MATGSAGWESFRLFLDAAHDAVEDERERAANPVECPYDGEPLRTNGAGELYCPFGGSAHGHVVRV